jgi:hypothetical protein
MPRQPNGEGNGGGPLFPPPPPPDPYTGPNYAGFVFTLVSSNGSPTHILTISTQADKFFFEMAEITGFWNPENNPSGSTNPISGFISGNGESQNISCAWNIPADYHVLNGTLTYSAGSGPGGTEAEPSAYLDGTVTVYDNGNPQSRGPGHVSGTGEAQLLAHP